MESKWKLKEANIESLECAKLNANEMSDDDFKRLVENIRKSNGLSSAIGCVKKEGEEKYIIFSGHHRYKAALELRMQKVPIIYAEESDLTNDEIIALQLSHNSLHGDDNKGILKRLFEEISSVEYKDFAHINIDEIENIHTDIPSFKIETEQYNVSLILYRDAIDNLDELLGMAEESVKNHDFVIMAEGSKNEDELIGLMTELNKNYKIKSVNIQFSKILEMAKNSIKEMHEDR